MFSQQKKVQGGYSNYSWVINTHAVPLERLCIYVCSYVWWASGPVIMFVLVSLMTDACSATQWWETQQRTGIFEDAVKKADFGVLETVWPGVISDLIWSHRGYAGHIAPSTLYKSKIMCNFLSAIF